MRLINELGEQVGITPTKDAIKLAEESGLDLVEVSPSAEPPVCRIMDYGKYRYEITRRAKVAKKKRHVIHVKEIKMRSEISEHDFDFKIKHALEFLDRGDKVKFTIVFRGREILHKEMGDVLMERITVTLQNVAVVERGVQPEGRNLVMIVSPK